MKKSQKASFENYNVLQKYNLSWFCVYFLQVEVNSNITFCFKFKIYISSIPYN
jgi:hypothetical protein